MSEAQRKAAKSALQKIAESLSERKRIVDAGLAKGQEKNAEFIKGLQGRVGDAEVKAQSARFRSDFYKEVMGEETHNGGTMRARNAFEEAKSAREIADYGHQVLDPEYRSKYGEMEQRLKKVKSRSDKIGKELSSVQEKIDLASKAEQANANNQFRTAWSKAKDATRGGQ